MREMGLRGAVHGRRYKVTTEADESLQRPADLVQRAFVATRLGQLWGADLTYVRAQRGFVYGALADSSKRVFKGVEGSASATLSAAVVFAHVRLPLGAVMGEAHRLLDHVAKEANGRNSLAAGVLKRGGMHCQWVTTWMRKLHSSRLPDTVRAPTGLPRLGSRKEWGFGAVAPGVWPGDWEVTS